MKSKTKNIPLKVIKIIIAVLAVLFIFYKIDYQTLNTINYTNFKFIFLVFLLMFFNWGIESYKWKLLINSFLNFKYILAVRSVISGVATSIFTPNRVGEFVGRLSFIPKEHIPKAIVSEIYGSLSQSFVTITAGLLALLSNHELTSQIKTDNTLIITTLTLVTIAILLILYKQKKLKEIIKLFKDISFGLILKITALSILRYFIFVLQFYLILRSLHFSPEIAQTFYAISIFYFLMMFLPVFTITEPGVRIGVSLLVFPFFNIPDNISLLAISLLWLINIAIPAIAGAVIFASSKK